MNRREKTIAAAYCDALAAAVLERSAQLRAELRAEAVAELEANGGAPTWRYDVGSVSLAVSKETVEIVDEQAFRKWVVERYPDKLVHTVTVSPAWQKTFLEQARRESDEEFVADPETGEVIPGVSLKPGGEPRSLTIRVESEAKQMLGFAAAAALESMAALSGPVVVAELEASDG